MARETAEMYYVVPEKGGRGNGKGNSRKVLFCTLRKGGIWQGKQQIGFMLNLKKGRCGRYGKGYSRKVVFCTLKKGGIWQEKRQIGFMLYLKKGEGGRYGKKNSRKAYLLTSGSC